MSALTKGIIGACTISGVCGGGYGLYTLLSNESIESKLKEDGFVLLNDDQEHKEHWTESLKNYVLVAKGESVFKFGNFKGEGTDPKGNPDAITQFKQFCKETVEKTTFEDSDYNKAKKWCVVPKTAKEILKKEGFTPLNTTEKDSTKNINKTEWTNKVTKYIEPTNTKKITKPDWGEAEKPKAANKADIEKFIKQCEKLQDTKTYDQHYETILSEAKEWCAINPKKINS